MDLEKFDWTKANHPRHFDNEFWGGYFEYEELLLRDASAEETQKAYNALINHGPVSDFSVAVWNDIMGKIFDVADVIDPEGARSRFYYTRLLIHTPDRQKWIDYAHENYPVITTEERMNQWLDEMWRRHRPGVLIYFIYNNAAHNCFPPFFGELPYVNSGDRLTGEHILALVEMINRWIGIDPLPMAKIEEFISTTYGKVSLPEPLSILFRELSSILETSLLMKMIPSILIKIEHEYRLGTYLREISELESLSFSSVINFMLLKMKVNVLDKFPIYLSFAYESFQNDSVLISLCGYLKLRIIADFYSFAVALLNLSYSSDVRPGGLEFISNISVNAQKALSLLLSITENLAKFTSLAKLKTRRPLPLSAYDNYCCFVDILVEHEGIETIEKEDETISFGETIDFKSGQSKNLGNVETLKVKESAKFNDIKSRNLDLAGIVILDEEKKELSSPLVSPLLHKGTNTFDEENSLNIATPLPLSENDKILKTHDFFEVGFANELSFTLRPGVIKTTRQSHVLDSVAQTEMLHEESLSTSETMYLEHTYGTAIEAEASFGTSSSSFIESNRSKEMESENSILTDILAQINFGLNAYFEAELNGLVTRFEGTMSKYHIHGVEAKETFIEALSYALLIKITDKVIAGEEIVETDIKALLVSKLMKFLVSDTNKTSVDYELKGTSLYPKHLSPKAIGIEQLLDVFLDSSFVKGDEALEAAGHALFDLNVEPVLMSPGESFTSRVNINQNTDVLLEESLSKRQEGKAISSSSSEASCALARVSLTLAIDIENELVTINEETKVSEIERTLYF